jgi:hypothetical protein
MTDGNLWEKVTDLFFALLWAPSASSLHAHAQLAVDPLNQSLGASELPALQGLSNEYQLWGLWGRRHFLEKWQIQLSLNDQRRISIFDAFLTAPDTLP